MVATKTDKFEQIWAAMSGADRQVLLGHDRDEITAAEKLRLGALAAACRKAQRAPAPLVSRRL